MPLAEKSFAFTVTCEIVRLVFPVLAMVTLLELEPPTLTEEKLKLVGVAVMVTVAATPEPLRPIVVGELGALLEIVTAADSVPALVGANKTLNVALCPAPSDAGVLKPLTLNPAPLSAIWPMVKVAVPVFVSVNVWDLVCPFTTLPKLKLVGDTLRPAWAAVPLNAMVSVGLEASLLTVTEPVWLPAVVGSNFAVSVAVCDAFSVAGVVNPLTEKAVPLAAMLEIFTAAFPVLVMAICLIVLLPVATVPKLTLVGFADSCPTAEVEPVPLNGTVMVALFGSLLVIARLPLTLPEVVGEKRSVA